LTVDENAIDGSFSRGRRKGVPSIRDGEGSSLTRPPQSLGRAPTAAIPRLRRVRLRAGALKRKAADAALAAIVEGDELCVTDEVLSLTRRQLSSQRCGSLPSTFVEVGAIRHSDVEDPVVGSDRARPVRQSCLERVVEQSLVGIGELGRLPDQEHDDLERRSEDRDAVELEPERFRCVRPRSDRCTNRVRVRSRRKATHGDVSGVRVQDRRALQTRSQLFAHLLVRCGKLAVCAKDDVALTFEPEQVRRIGDEGNVLVQAEASSGSASGAGTCTPRKKTNATAAPIAANATRAPKAQW